ncbi:MAG: 50S ribosomal protein L18 [Candidatus Zambryskibacteria bacterium RIFCSPHIGHO2_01_FULL_44_22b]|uniref:Large ribosomal subunit protein uL18 n=2 Tax=Candidatus Zambryskiibacteriota TaxID=1817925 RepID=A0A1G2SY39_9BACT|nr:MAG: 50S ribosomal protein L18 [Candidatus Zambryskibacteria bacterium RIFCSPHIGHO2_01_FULL_44_22b]OHB05550.1 MAG: 50S ribosomal protein L18 [Candidatus Zambryskibacteria bacterium RIFCSPLOWO2_01_FULL_45_43]
MKSLNLKSQNRERRHKRIRAKVSGTADFPRLSVFKSNKAMYAQLVDDTRGVTLASAKGADASKVGEELAKQALAKNIKSAVFDRGGYVYTGKVSNLAEACRKAGLKF